MTIQLMIILSLIAQLTIDVCFGFHVEKKFKGSDSSDVERPIMT